MTPYAQTESGTNIVLYVLYIDLLGTVDIVYLQQVKKNTLNTFPGSEYRTIIKRW